MSGKSVLSVCSDLAERRGKVITIGSRKKSHVRDRLEGGRRRHEMMMGKGENYTIKAGNKRRIVSSGAGKKIEIKWRDVW